MTVYVATRFNPDTCERIRYTAVYDARTITEAVRSCLYTHRLHHGHAYLGPTGRVVYCPTCGADTITQKEATP